MKKAINILSKNGFKVVEQFENTVKVEKPSCKLVITKEGEDDYLVSMYEFHNGYTTEDYFECELEDLKDFE